MTSPSKSPTLANGVIPGLTEKSSSIGMRSGLKSFGPILIVPRSLIPVALIPAGTATSSPNELVALDCYGIVLLPAWLPASRRNPFRPAQAGRYLPLVCRR